MIEINQIETTNHPPPPLLSKIHFSGPMHNHVFGKSYPFVISAGVDPGLKNQIFLPTLSDEQTTRVYLPPYINAQDDLR